MPTYEYECLTCGIGTEAYRKKREPYPCPPCDECGGKTRKLISMPVTLGVNAWKPYRDAGLGVNVTCAQDIDNRLAQLAQPQPYETVIPSTGKTVTLEIPGQKLEKVGLVRGSSDAVVEDSTIDEFFDNRTKAIASARAAKASVNASHPSRGPKLE